MMRHILVNDAPWNHPLRVHLHILDTAGKQRSLSLQTAKTNAHGECVVMIDGHEVHRRNIDHYILAMVLHGIFLPPPATFHVAEYLGTQVLVTPHLRQPFLQGSIELTARLHLREENAQRVDFHLAYCHEKEVATYTIHRNIEETTIANRTFHRVVTTWLYRVKPIQEIRGIGKTETLTSHITEVSLGEPIFQSCQYGIDITLLRTVELKRADRTKVLFQTPHTETASRESHIAYSPKPVEQGIGTTIHALAVNPQELSFIHIIAAGTMICRRSILVCPHQAVDKIAYTVRIDGLSWFRELSERLNSHPPVGIRLMFLASSKGKNGNSPQQCQEERPIG